MTAKTIEEQIISHAKGLATLEEGVKHLRENFSEAKSGNVLLFQKVEESIETQSAEVMEIKSRLNLLEKDVADHQRDIEKARSNRTTLINGLIVA